MIYDKRHVHRGAYAPHESNHWGICRPSKYAPDKIQNSMFLPLMKKAQMGGIGGRRKKMYLFRYYFKIFCPPLVCFTLLGTQNYLGGKNLYFTLRTLIKIFLHTINI